MHRFTIVVNLLALGHEVGSGTDARSWWMVAMLATLTAPIVFAFSYRMLPTGARRAPATPRQGARPQAQLEGDHAQPVREWLQTNDLSSARGLS